MLFDQLVALVDQVDFTDRSGWPRHRAIQFIMLAKNLRTFHSAIDRLTKGSYQDAMTLTRTIYEDASSESSTCPSTATILGSVSSQALDAEPVQRNRHRPRRPAARLALVQRHVDTTHANRIDVVPRLAAERDRSGEPERFGLAYEDDVKLVETVLPILQFLTFVYLRFVREVLIGSAEVRNAAAGRSRSGAAVGAVRARWPAQDYWHQVLRRHRLLTPILETADAGDWKAYTTSALWSCPGRRGHRRLTT